MSDKYIQTFEPADEKYPLDLKGILLTQKGDPLQKGNTKSAKNEIQKYNL